MSPPTKNLLKRLFLILTNHENYIDIKKIDLTPVSKTSRFSFPAVWDADGVMSWLVDKLKPQLRERSETRTKKWPSLISHRGLEAFRQMKQYRASVICFSWFTPTMCSLSWLLCLRMFTRGATLCQDTLQWKTGIQSFPSFWGQTWEDFRPLSVPKESWL